MKRYILNLLSVIPIKNQLFITAFRFGTVGLSGVGVNIGLLWYLTEIIGFYYLFSSVIAVEASIISNFIFNELWTFNTDSGNSLFKKAFTFNLIYAFGLIINVGVLWVASEYFDIYYILANCIGIIVAFVWNFFFSNRFVWDGPRIGLVE
ncbi:GtrA family protein [Halonotius terrestris]|uniref:GtrA family protein n=1 Tax=Halonotius terrestris TaxID=2487750 RepID=A0A8J8PB53_9EURY|nr:GtrA family protein [Halonotius terrestris]TQQ83369.1 GtrA family protein [Halonotius terrestris]